MEDYAVTVMGILATVERIVCLIEEKEEILARIEPIVRSCVVSIFKNFCSSTFVILFYTFFRIHDGS